MITLEKNHIIVALLRVKQIYFGERYITEQECSQLIQYLIKRLEYFGVNIVVLDHINLKYFEVYHKLVTLKKQYDFSEIELEFPLKDFRVANILENSKSLYQELYCHDELPYQDQKLEVSKREIQKNDLEKIIQKVLTSPKDFYEKVARELSKEEYQFLLSQLEIQRACYNCSSVCLGGLTSKSTSCCRYWSNDEAVGKLKVLSPNVYQNKEVNK